MPQIRPSADLRNNYGEISALCHENEEPVFITKNGKGDLAVMSMEAYENISERMRLNRSRMELYSLIGEALEDVHNGRVYTIEEVYDDLDIEE